MVNNGPSQAERDSIQHHFEVEQCPLDVARCLVVVVSSFQSKGVSNKSRATWVIVLSYLFLRLTWLKATSPMLRNLLHNVGNFKNANVYAVGSTSELAKVGFQLKIEVSQVTRDVEII